MIMSAYTELPIPLWQDEQGAIQIAKTRVTLDVIIAAYQHGDTPNEINQRYPTLTMADIYAVLAYYVNHREWVHAYLRERDEQADLIYHEIDAPRPEGFDFHATLSTRIMH